MTVIVEKMEAKRTIIMAAPGRKYSWKLMAASPLPDMRKEPWKARAEEEPEDEWLSECADQAGALAEEALEFALGEGEDGDEGSIPVRRWRVGGGGEGSR